MTDVRAILAALVAFDTTSDRSNLDLIAWIEAQFARHGVWSQRVPDPTGTKACLWGTIGPRDVPGYVLSGHTDAVPVTGQAWTSDPFTLREAEGRLYGRGTVDMKGFIAACLAKLPEMAAAPLARPIHFLFTHDEETGCIGVRFALERIAELAPARPLAAFVGEPTGMQVVIAHKSRFDYCVTVRGRSCHSSLAPQGVNAIEAAARVIGRIADIGRRFADEGPRDGLYDVDVSTAQTGTIEGGTALNIVPNRCSFTFEFRTLAQVDPWPYDREVRAFACEEVEPGMKARDGDAGIEIELKNGIPGFESPLDSEAVRLAERFTGRSDHAKVSYGTEAGLIAAVGGIPAVVVGPGSIARAHRPDEYVEIAELEACGRFLDGLIAHCRA
ncbi:acetylornithine deacetylase [Siculibacillus lacustris]|uniref:Acetylornithine deacetylase n=1 Tax=Siculibacillus lacustris TaxID=1549641 RepID=A0A4Q9VG60_9HYPH|nr:acetylornithine deacetylase [Siculibacillus lacustris]TBW33021.1 acetylornithine deacetylase [Siculibacillus lacustris]